MREHVPGLADACARLVEECRAVFVALPNGVPRTKEEFGAVVLLAAARHELADDGVGLSARCQLARLEQDVSFEYSTTRLMLMPVVARWRAWPEADSLDQLVRREFHERGVNHNATEKFFFRVQQRTEELWQAVEDRRAGAAVRAGAVETRLKDLLPEGLFLRPFQITGVSAVLDRGCSCLLSDDMGLGKTIESLAVLLLEQRRAFPALIVCEKSMVMAWVQQVRRWLARLSPIVSVAGKGFSWTNNEFSLLERDLEDLAIRARKRKNGSVKFFMDGIAAVMRDHQDLSSSVDVRVDPLRFTYRIFRKDDVPRIEDRPRVVVCSWAWLLRNRAALMRIPFGAVIADEAQEYILDDNSKTSTALSLVSSKASIRLILSGTPMPNGRPIQLYGQMVFVRAGNLPRKSAYGRKFCGPSVVQVPARNKLGYRDVTVYNGRSNEPDFARLLERCQVRRLKAEIPGEQLPDVIRYTVPVELSPKDRLLCEQERDKARARLSRLAEELRVRLLSEGRDAGDIELEVKRVLMARVAVELSAMRVAVGCAKARFLPQLIEDLCVIRKERVVVFCYHHEVFDVALSGLVQLLGEDQVLTGRGDSGSVIQRKALTDRWQAGEGQVILLSTAYAQGVTLTSARHMVLVERLWVPDKERQMEARTDRIGQDRDCFYHYLIAPGTTDDRVGEVSSWKEKGIGAVHGTVEERLLEWVDGVVR